MAKIIFKNEIPTSVRDDILWLFGANPAHNVLVEYEDEGEDTAEYGGGVVLYEKDCRGHAFIWADELHAYRMELEAHLGRGGGDENRPSYPGWWVHDGDSYEDVL